VQNDLSDQISGNDKEDVDTDEAGRNLVGECMKGNHRHHREGAQAVNIWSVARRHFQSFSGIEGVQAF